MSLSLIKKNEEIKTVRMFLYGEEGLGKTTFGAKAQNPVFILTEDGLGSLDVDHFPLILPDQKNGYNTFLSYLRTLCTEKHDYKTLVIDSADWLESVVMTYIDEKYTKVDRSYGKESGLIAEAWNKIFSALSYVRGRGMDILFLAHSKLKRIDPLLGSGYDKYIPKMSETAAGKVKEWCDCVLFLTRNIEVEKREGSMKKAGKVKRERIVYSGESGAFDAKNRYGLPSVVPFDFDKIVDMCKNSKKKVLEEVVEENVVEEIEER